MALTIHEKTVLRYLLGATRERVESFVVACQSHLKSLGIKAKNDKTKPYTGKLPAGSDQVNQAGVLRWMASVTNKPVKNETKADKEQREADFGLLLLFHATAKSRL